VRDDNLTAVDPRGYTGHSVTGTVPVMCGTYRGPVDGLHSADVDNILKLYPLTGGASALSSAPHNGPSASMELGKPVRPAVIPIVPLAENYTPPDNQSSMISRPEPLELHQSQSDLVKWQVSSQSPADTDTVNRSIGRISVRSDIEEHLHDLVMTEWSSVELLGVLR
jgi:hypothetical protein